MIMITINNMQLFIQKVIFKANFLRSIYRIFLNLKIVLAIQFKQYLNIMTLIIMKETI